MKVSPEDRDYLIRTVIGEANGQPSIGQAAVAHVILNRLKSGKYGKSVKDVVLAKNQFEPWQTRAKELKAYRENSYPYQSAAMIVDSVLGGSEDPTGGATHFLNEDIVRERRGGKLPKWASGRGLRIGDHTFHAPVEGGRRETALDGINKAIGADPAGAPPQSASAFSADDGGGGGDGGFAAFKASLAKPVEAAKHSAGSDPAFEAFKSSMKPATPEPTGAEAPVSVLQAGSRPPVPESAMTPEQKLEHEKGLAHGREGSRREYPNIFSAMAKQASEGWDALTAGDQKNWLPTVKVEQKGERTPNIFGLKSPTMSLNWEQPGFIGQKVGGLLSILSSPLKIASDPLAQMTGNKDFADKMEALVPGRTLMGVKPTSRVASAPSFVSKLVPDESIPEVLERARRNPNLTLADVSESARARLATVGTDQAAPQAIDFVSKFVKERDANKRAAITDAVEVLGKLPDPTAVITHLDDKVNKVGKEVIEPVVKRAKPADIGSLLKDIDRDIGASPKLPPTEYQQWLKDVRERLAGDLSGKAAATRKVDGDKGLHTTQMWLRAEAQRLIDKGGLGASVGVKLMKVRDQIVDAIEKSSPGYKDALRDYRAALEAREAFDTGLNLSRKPSMSGESILEQSPKKLRDWVSDKNTHPDAVEAARWGALSWARSLIDDVRAGKQLQDIDNLPALKEKLEILFGVGPTKQLLSELADVKDMSKTVDKLTRQSTTFDKMSGADVRPVRKVGERKHDDGASALWPLVVGAAVEAPIAALTGLQGAAASAGAAASVASKAGKIVKHVAQKRREAKDIMGRLEEARLLTTPIAQQPSLIHLLQSRRDGGKSKKLSDRGAAALGSNFLRALPR